MSLYEKYIEGWEGHPYVTGRDDCYGLVRKWMAKNYGLKLTNYARPLNWDDAGMNLLGNYFAREGFNLVITPLNRLQIGDLLLMRVVNPVLRQRGGVANHVGVYVGNGYFLHHLFGIKSKADAMTSKWTHRVLDVIRHPDVTAANLEAMQTVDLMTLLPPHLKERYAQAIAGKVESVG